MHVVCLLRDNEMVQQMKEYKKDYAVYSKKTMEKEMYAFCYVDGSSENLTCQNRGMRQELLKQAVYDRWIDYGTIHGITHHSMVCMTEEKEYAWQAVVLPFLSEYVEMQIIVLLQRASILYFSDRVSNVSEKIQSYKSKGDVLHNETATEIFNLQLDFQKCKNQIMLDEVTAQEQGIELFDRMREAMYITKEINILDEKIEGLNQLAMFDNGKKQEAQNQELNRYVNRLTVWSILFAALALVITIVPIGDLNIWNVLPDKIVKFRNDNLVKWGFLVLYVVVPLIGTWVTVVHYPLKQWIKKRWKKS